MRVMPMSTPLARASPMVSFFIASTVAATNRSWMPSVTMIRDDAVQRWPVEKKPPCTAQFTAVARSMSSPT
jgi:hypothetical protein